MSTLTSTPASLVRPVSPTGAKTHRPGWPVTAFIAAAVAVLIVVAALSVWWATSDSSTTPARVVQSTNAAEQTITPSFAHTGPAVRRAIAPAVVGSTNAAEQPSTNVIRL